MDEINYEALKITETEANKVKIANSADRPNAFNSYRLSKMDSTDVKKMFDKPFELAMKKHNALVDQMEANDKAVAERLDEQDERIASAEGVVDQLRKEADSGAFKGDAYILTEEDKAEIAGMTNEALIGDVEEALNRIIIIQNELLKSEGLSFEKTNDGYIITGVNDCTDTNIIIPIKYEGLPVTGIGEDAFRGCTNLTSVTIPSSVTSIGKGAFLDCTGLINITIGSGVKNIGVNAFDGCVKLETLYYNATNCICVYEGLSEEDKDQECYKRSPFTKCGTESGGFTAIIGNNVKTLPDRLFKAYVNGDERSEVNLTSVTIPSSVTSIGEDAFAECPNLTDIYVSWSDGRVLGAPWGADNDTIIHYDSEV